MSVVSNIFKCGLHFCASFFFHLFSISFVLHFTKVLVYNGVEVEGRKEGRAKKEKGKERSRK